MLMSFPNDVDDDEVTHMINNFEEDVWEPILINSDYYLLDGQHRLQLAFRTGIKFIDVIMEKKKDPEKINRCIEMLGLKPGASQEEVNQAYRDLVNVWHPDRFADNQRLQKKAEEKLKEINASYEYIMSFYRPE